jgi:predicted amidophosphoribosyltransferase
MYLNVSEKERGVEICPKCGKERQMWQSYCKECYNKYHRERRKANPEIKKKNTEYMREYRKRLKEPSTAKPGVNLY